MLGLVSAGLRAGLDDIKGLLQFKHFYDFSKLTFNIS